MFAGYREILSIHYITCFLIYSYRYYEIWLCLEFFNDAMQMLTVTFFPTVYSVFAWIAGHR